MPHKLHRSIVSRIKVLSQLDITELRQPQDGRFDFLLGGRKISVRVSVLPVEHGQKLVLRLHGQASGKTLMSLDDMLISRPILESYRQITKCPSGIIFVTGPTGSGKTTTLYATMAEINWPNVNISTIEDPIEIKLEGINQSQINPAINLRLADLLRAMLRQDPDVILVGGIRDAETARIATQVALAGHLVFSTLHTNSAPETVTRMRDIGVEHYMIASSIRGVVGQRMAARICEHCKVAYTPAVETLERYFHFDPANVPEVTLFRGRGCKHCNDNGYRGRIAFHELFLVNNEIRDLIAHGASQPFIRRRGLSTTSLRWLEEGLVVADDTRGSCQRDTGRV